MNAFCLRCRESADMGNIRNKLLLEIASLTHGDDQVLIEFTLQSLQNESTLVTLKKFSTVS